jgi:hypothetical protein
MRITIVLVVAMLALWLADRLLLAAEARGWIYYRRRKASPGTRASAFLEMQSMFEPGRTHEVEAIRREESERDDSGDPPSTGTSSR